MIPVQARSSSFKWFRSDRSSEAYDVNDVMFVPMIKLKSMVLARNASTIIDDGYDGLFFFSLFFVVKIPSLRIMGFQNWWFGGPRTLLYRVKPGPMILRVGKIVGDFTY